MTNVLQHLLMPNWKFGAPEEMYVRIANHRAYALGVESEILFHDGGKISFDTYFNGITVSTWKQHCELKNVYLILNGFGRFIIRFGLHRIGYAHRWVDERVIEFKEGKDIKIEMEFWDSLESGMLYVEMTALKDGVLASGYFGTDSTPFNKVKLGIVITHFNRKQYVIPAIRRIKTDLLEDPRYKGKIDLLVVDNSQNITEKEAESVTVIPNKNLGGSGGFMRGLIHLEDEKSFTHCLFMDDDASCETESIKRVYAMLQFAKTPNFAFSGSLLRENEPYRLMEKGATFFGYCQLLKSGLDMRSVHDLLIAEIADRKPTYGGWWFFAFAISDVKKHAFPFFVRGDDILFGALNHFNIVTLNGIGCWGEDFGLKSSPLTRYLDTRNHIVQGFVNHPLSVFQSVKLLLDFFFSALYSYNYASARAASLALDHVTQGPVFWKNNMDMAAVREEIASFSSEEKMVSFDRASVNIQYRGPHETWLRHLIRRLSLNGFLLPSFLFERDAVVFQHKSFSANLSEIFLFEKVLYEYEPQGIGYIATHNKGKFIKEVILFSMRLVRFLVNFDKLKVSYQKDIDTMTDGNFWRNELL